MGYRKYPGVVRFAQGCVQIFREGRKQYFLPGFLRGNTGIAWVLLRYAELL